MSFFLKTYAKQYSCANCGQKVKRLPLGFGDTVLIEIIFWICYGMAFLFVGFFVQGFGGSASVATLLSLVLVSLIAIPIYFSQSKYNCSACNKISDFSEVKSHGWF